MQIFVAQNHARDKVMQNMLNHFNEKASRNIPYHLCPNAKKVIILYCYIEACFYIFEFKNVI